MATLAVACLSAAFFWCAAPHVELVAATGGERQRIDSMLRLLQAQSPKQEALPDLLNEISLAYNAYIADSALVYAEKALGISKKLQYKRGTATAYRNMGFAFQRIGRLADATSYYLGAVPLFEEMRDSLGLANVWNGLGICYFEQGDFENALTFYQRAEPLFLLLGKMDRYAASFSNIGYTYLQMGNLYLAKFYAEKALALAEKHNAPVIMMFALSHLGDIARRNKDYAASEAYFAQSLTLSAQYPDNTVTNSRMYYLLGYLYTDLKQYDKARLYLDSSLAISLRGNMRFRVKDAYQGFQHLYESMEDFRAAYQYQKLVVLYSDSLFNQQSARQIAAMQREISLRQQESQISLLRKNNELQQITRNALLGVIIVIVLAGGFIARAYWQMRRANDLLTAQNQQILVQRLTVEKQAEEIAFINNELYDNNRFLTDLNEEKSQFMRIAAHDLKNPLTGIRGLAEYLALDAGRLPLQEITLLADRIRQTADRMFQLVKNLLDVNAIESGSLALKPTNTDISGIVETSVQNYMEATKAKNITLRFTTLAKATNVSDDALAEFCAFADEQAVMQIVDNLVSNAVKYTPPGKRVFVRLLREVNSLLPTAEQSSIDKDTPQDFIRIEVQDEGPGLTEDDRLHLFGKFKKLSARPTADEDSTGLGLSIVKHLVGMMHAQVWCESEYGSGATFILRLPAV